MKFLPPFGIEDNARFGISVVLKLSVVFFPTTVKDDIFNNYSAKNNI